jgi:lysyl-tRNA synthetase class 2
MSSEETLLQVRRDKHQELNGGTYPLATNEVGWSIASVLSDIDYLKNGGGDYPLTIPVTVDLAEAKGNGTRTVHGRISALRKSGALTFIKLTDSSGSMQLVAARNNFPTDYDRFRLLDLGDIIEVTGEQVLTKTGERSLLLSGWKVLTKSHRAPPEKFAGIADQELKYRKRYLDLMSNEESRARFVIRSTIVQAIREYMCGRNFMEVETSTLSSIASGANAKPFSTHHNSLDIDLRLRIAPELNLKRLLVGGFDRVFEIGRNYRNEGIDTRHNPEFTMMESYQAYGNFPDLITFTKSLLHHVINYCDFHLPAWAGAYFKKWRTERSSTFTKFAEIPMWDAVIHAASKAEIMFSPTIHPLVDEASGDNSIEIINPNNERLQKIDTNGLQQALINCSSNGEKFAVLFEYLSEPFLIEDYRTEDCEQSLPVFITQYPKAISPLARAYDKAPTLCERFELFVDGRELANAFQELNDPDEQALRFREQLEHNEKNPMDYDADYVEALEYGMPPAIGFGMGIDRLVMLLTNTTSIKDVILFPTLRPEK